jgi:hypothetical protein
MAQNIKTFIDSLDNFLQQLQKEAASEDVTTGANATDEVLDDTELSIPKDENVTDYDTGSHHEEVESELNKDNYYGHSGDIGENTDSGGLPHKQTDLSPGLEEANEGEIPSKRKAKDLGETETDITTKESHFKLASAIKNLCNEISQYFEKDGEVGLVMRKFSAKEKQAAAEVVKDAYAEALYVIDFLNSYRENLIKVAQETPNDENEEKEEKEEKKPSEGASPSKDTGSDETSTLLDVDNNNPENVDVEGQENDLISLLRDLNAETGSEGDVNAAPNEEAMAPLPTPQEEDLQKQSAVIAQLFSEALDYLGVNPNDLSKSKKLSKQAAAELSKAVSNYRLKTKGVHNQLKLGRSAKYAKLFNQLTDYIREILQ